MARAIADIEREIRGLGRLDQERLLRTLLEELDGQADPDADSAWLDEVQRRSAEFDLGLVKPQDRIGIYDLGRGAIAASTR